MAKQTLAAVLCGAVLVAVSACAAPGSGAPSESVDPGSATAQTAEPTAGPSAGEPTADPSAAPSQTGSSESPPTEQQPPSPTGSTTSGAPAPKPGADPWPPKLVFSEILEAGTTTLQLGKVSLMLPAGFVSTGAGSYSSTWPTASGPATITVTQQPATGAAGELLAQHGTWARSAPVSIPNATSAAMADAVSGGVQTWGLAIVDSSGTATVATFAAAPQDYQDYLIYQSVSSVAVAA